MDLPVFYIPYAKLTDIPKEKLRDFFKEYWFTIYEMELNYKPIICSSINNNIILIQNRCFACEESFRKKMVNFCSGCPLDIYRKMADTYNAPCANGWEPYGIFIFLETEDSDTRSISALQIAKLSWTDT